jgi:hypothetical protein
MIREIKNSKSKFDGIIYVQSETHTDYPDPNIPEEHSRQITQRMTPGELDRRLTFVYDESGPILPEVFDKVVERISEGIPNPPHIAIEGNPVSESPEEWEGLEWGGRRVGESYIVNREFVDGLGKRSHIPCNVGTYDDFNFADKLTIRLGRVSETEWVWQILAQDERFLDRNYHPSYDKYEYDYKGIVRSYGSPEIWEDCIFLRGHGTANESINHFTAAAERMHEIFSQLHDWSLNWPGFAE